MSLTYKSFVRFKEFTGNPEGGQRIAFNCIVYDGNGNAIPNPRGIPDPLEDAVPVHFTDTLISLKTAVENRIKELFDVTGVNVTIFVWVDAKGLV